jgi:hypothetical protein
MLKAMRSDFLTIRTSAFYDLYKPQVQDLVGKSQILIACYKNDHDLIYGYVVYEKLDDILILHWVNVKLPFRRMGLAKLMLKELGKDTEDPAFSTYEFKLTEITQRHFIKFKPELRRALAATR